MRGPGAGLTDAASRRVGREEFTVLVERLRGGPPWYSPFRVGTVDAMLNTIEFFVHHEDIRRAQPSWQPRTLSPRAERMLWKQLRVAAKRLVRDVPVGVALERRDTGERTVVRDAEPAVVVRGLPSELVLYVNGRKQHAEVELVGSDDAVAALAGSDLGV